MPPKVKVTKEEIVRAGLDVVRREGVEGLNARQIAAELGCSTQPVFSNYQSMEDLRRAVLTAAAEICDNYSIKEIAAGNYPSYKASGMGYIRFAQEEKNLFRLLYMRNRGNQEENFETRRFDQMGDLVQDYVGLECDRARIFHLEMWIFVHGIAVMMATGYLELDMELVSQILSDAYWGIKQRFEKE